MGLAKRIKEIDLLASVSAGVYDKDKTSLLGGAFLKVVNSIPCVGAALTKATDPFTATGGAFTLAAQGICVTENGHMFLAQVNATNIIIALYNYSNATKTVGSFVGRIQVNTPLTVATAHTIREFGVYNDAGATGWQIAIGTTASVLLNAGAFRVHNVAMADFTSSPTIFGMAIASDAKAVYRMAESGFEGANYSQLQVINGGGVNQSNGRAYFQNGLVAAMQFFEFSLTATPSVVLQTCTSPTAPASPTFTLTGHGYALNDTVVITSAAPGGFVLSTAVAQTVYFVRNVTANTFELSATSGGAAINATTAVTPTFTRAFGSTTSCFLAKTAANVSGFTGTLLLTGSQSIVTMANTGTALDGQLCYTVWSATFVHAFPVSEITSGAVAFPSLQSINVLGSGVDVTTPTPVHGQVCPELGGVVYITSASTFVWKPWANNALIAAFGGQLTNWLENFPSANTVALGFTATNSFEYLGGAIFVGGSTVGQRVVVTADISADYRVGSTYVVSPVFASPAQLLHSISTFEPTYDETDTWVVEIRTAATASDPMFNSNASGWVSVPNAQNLNGFAVQAYSQVRFSFDVANVCIVSPAQLNAILWGYESLLDMDTNWAVVNDGSTQGATSPSDAVFELREVYPSAVPTMYARDVDKDTFLTVGTVNTAANPLQFNYSTDGGLTWLPLGTIPNVKGTRLRFRRTLPGGTEAYVSLRAS